MVSFGIRQARKVIAASFALAVGSGVTVAQPAGHADGDRQLLERIQEILSRDGPNSAALLEPLSQLLLLYLEGGDEGLAAVAIERAVQVVRVNSGLHSLEQAPLIQQLIRVEEARGNHAAAWQLEQGLLSLVRRHPNDVRTVPILRDIAAKQLKVLGDFVAGKNPPQVVLGCFYKASYASDAGNCESGSRKTAVHGMLGESQRNYSDAIAVMLRNDLYDSDELRELELELLRVVASLRPFDVEPSHSHLVLVPRFAGPEFSEPWRSRTTAIAALAAWTPPPFGGALGAADDVELMPEHARFSHSYYRGRQSLGRLHSYAAASGNPTRQADAITQLADWDLMYSRHGQAVKGYERAYAMLEEVGATPEAIEDAFAPPMPVVLPAFQPNPLAKDETRQATGHVDLAFAITKYGRGRDIELIGAENATPDAVEGLVSFVKTARFRPRVSGGRFADATPVVVRYHLYETGRD